MGKGSKTPILRGIAWSEGGIKMKRDKKDSGRHGTRGEDEIVSGIWGMRRDLSNINLEDRCDHKRHAKTENFATVVSNVEALLAENEDWANQGVQTGGHTAMKDETSRIGEKGLQNNQMLSNAETSSGMQGAKRRERQKKLQEPKEKNRMKNREAASRGASSSGKKGFCC